jgi:hypothetical protein
MLPLSSGLSDTPWLGLTAGDLGPSIVSLNTNKPAPPPTPHVGTEFLLAPSGHSPRGASGLVSSGRGPPPHTHPYPHPNLSDWPVEEIQTRDGVQDPPLFFSLVQTHPTDLAKLLTRAAHPGLASPSPGCGDQAQWYHPPSGEPLIRVREKSLTCEKHSVP